MSTRLSNDNVLHCAEMGFFTIRERLTRVEGKY